MYLESSDSTIHINASWKLLPSCSLIVVYLQLMATVLLMSLKDFVENDKDISEEDWRLRKMKYK